MKTKVSLPRSLLCFYVILSVLNLLQNTFGASVSTLNRNVTAVFRMTRQTQKCDGFKCTTSGECLEAEKRCDGKPDCKDGSDEFNDCKELIDCPGFLFTCDYGACIDSDKKCDGKKDCRDNSDEANCLTTNSVEKVSSNCKSDQFECKSGQCISQEDKCNGKPDCPDRSDETKETCLNMQCPGWTFKCDYGACVDGFAKCNNVKDCVDNSDEEDCDAPPVVPTPTPTSLPPVVDPTNGCVLPEYPDFGGWSIVGNAPGNPSQRVGISTSLEFRCNDGYKLSSENKYLVCTENQWSVKELPKCLKKCRPLYTTKFTTIRCYKGSIEIKCDEATDGDFATFECARLYESTDRRTPKKRFCYGGTWNYPEPVCRPVCGEKKVTAEPLIVNGAVVEKGDYPWVTAIYHKFPNSSFANVCGGSMLTQRVILTAAHCVTNDFGELLPIENIQVGVGKYYNRYQDPRDTQAQYSMLAKIYVPQSYKGDSQRFNFDIALLITKNVLLLSKVVQPVCYQNVPNIHLNPPLMGVVTGWGYTLASGMPSDELREVPIPYKSQTECEKELPSEWAQKYLTFDKMCAGHYNSSIAVCKGDSGGGLVYPYEGRYFVHGVVSIGHGLTNGCNIQISSLYTKISSHYEWVEEIVEQYNFV